MEDSRPLNGFHILQKNDWKSYRNGTSAVSVQDWAAISRMHWQKFKMRLISGEV